MSLLKQIRYEKARMNRIRYIVNYVVVPIYFLIVLISLFVAGSLMSIDEHRYLPVFVSVMAGFVVLTTGLLASVPYVRKMEIATEIKKHSLDTVGVMLDEGKYIVDIDEELHLEFAVYGIQINADDFAYYDFVIQIETSNYFNQIQVMVNFALKPDRLLELNEQEFLSSFRIELTRELLFAIKTFDIPIKNQDELDFILDNREEAFTRIYKTGHI